MSGFLLVFFLALLPAAANLLGALLAEVCRIPDRFLSLSLHLAAGIVLAVVGLELIPAALSGESPWVPLVAFVVGGVVFVGLDSLVGVVHVRFGGAGSASATGVFGAVALDLFSDGAMIGTAAAIDPGLGLLLALGQVPADLPEGFAALAALRRAGVQRRRRLLLSSGFALPVLFGALLGFVLLRDAPEVVTFAVLALTGGALTAVVVEEMVSEAHSGETSRLGPVFLTAGFALFAGLSVYLGA